MPVVTSFQIHVGEFAKVDPSWKVNVPNFPWVLEIMKGGCVGCGSSTSKTLLARTISNFSINDILCDQ
jgi:hypothetical protein